MTITPAKGFLTADGAFYQDAKEAIYHDASVSLQEAARYEPAIDTDVLLSFIKGNVQLVYAFCAAYQGLNEDGGSRTNAGGNEEPSNSQNPAQEQTTFTFTRSRPRGYIPERIEPKVQDKVTETPTHSGNLKPLEETQSSADVQSEETSL